MSNSYRGLLFIWAEIEWEKERERDGMILHAPSICLPMCLLSKHFYNEHFNKICTYTLKESCRNLAMK